MSHITYPIIWNDILTVNELVSSTSAEYKSEFERKLITIDR